jgi:dolichol-phosphate mannosyltransferase
VAMVALSFRTAVMIHLIQAAGLAPSAALLGGIITAVVVNFLGSKLWAFHSPAESPTLLIPLKAGMVWGTIGVLVGWRLLYAGVLQLLPEETYYWNYAMHPAPSYFDHPPMVAWVIRAGTLVAGSGELGVRLGFLLLGLGSSWLLYRLGSLWFTERVGLGAALAFHLLPFALGAAFLAMPDGPLIFFWLLTAYGVSLALARGDGRWWLVVGAALGLALLSKYRAILLVPAVGLLLAGGREFRRWLFRPEPYLGILIAGLFFAPVILWNAQHDWASFAFQLDSRLRHHEHTPLVNLLKILGSQMALQTPFFAGMMLALWVGLRARNGASERGWAFGAAFSLPCLGAFTLYGLQSWVKVNWVAPAYLSLIPAGVALYLRSPVMNTSRFTRFIRAGVRATPYVFFFLAVPALYHLTVGIAGLPAPPEP